MKKVVATLSAAALLAMSIVPTFADEHGGHEFQGQKIKVQFQENDNTDINFYDVQGFWAQQYIQDLVKKGVLHGLDKHHFEPNASVNRAQWAVMVSSYFGLTAPTTTTQDFKDVPVGSWEYKYVESMKDYFDAYRLGGNLFFEPQKAATRQDVTVTLVKVLAQMDSSVKVMDAASADALLQQQFSDWSQINANLRPYVATAVQYGLIHGDGKGHFRALSPLSRAEAATLLDLLLNNGIVVDGGSSTGTTTTTSNVTTLTTSDNAVVTSINNTTHALTVATNTTVQTLKSDLSVNNGVGTVAVYTDNTQSTVAADTATVANTMTVVATAQDGTTKTVYTVSVPVTPLDNVTTLTTNDNTVVTNIDNTNHLLTVAANTTVQTLQNDLSVDAGKGKVTVYTDSTKATVAGPTAAVTATMVVVSTAQDGATTATYSVAL